MSELNGPLAGYKVLDLTRLLPGPVATQNMADLGAEVIKIEDIDHPDYTRFFPPLLGGESVHFLSVNRSKKSLALKLGSDEGRTVLYQLEIIHCYSNCEQGFRFSLQFFLAFEALLYVLFMS